MNMLAIQSYIRKLEEINAIIERLCPANINTELMVERYWENKLLGSIYAKFAV